MILILRLHLTTIILLKSDNYLQIVKKTNSRQSTYENSYLQQIHTYVDNNRHLSTIYTQDIHSQKDDKTDIFRHLSPLSTDIIIKVIIKIIYINII